MKCGICNKRKCKCGSVEAVKMLIKPALPGAVLNQLGEDKDKKPSLGELFWRVSCSAVGVQNSLAKLSLE